MRSRRSLVACVVLGSALLGCGVHEGREVGVIESSLNAAERRARLTQIRDAAAAAGLANGVLLAGIAENETGLAHCWSEATWACQGPVSADCGGGPVIAGSGDGPCPDMQGGLGMFQFDAGTYDQTLAREGTRILSIAGNVEAAIDFVIAMVIRSTYIDGVDTNEQAIAWMNGVVVGGAGHMEWIQTVTHYYNGCVPGRCSIYDDRFMNYSNGLTRVWNEMGAEFWMGAMPPTCEPIPAAGGFIDEGDACALLGGDLRFWRVANDAGYGGTLRWTNATSSASPSNYATWTMRFAQAGDYEILLHLDPAYAQSTRAPYSLAWAGGTESITVDQSAEPIRSLGVFAFETGTDYLLRVDDNSGEPVSDMVHIVADAIEIRAMSTAPDDAGVVTPPGDASTPPTGDADAGMSGGMGRPIGSGGCSAGRGSRAPGLAPSAALLFLLGLGLVLRRRR